MTAPVAIKVIRFQCPFCRRSWAHKSAAEHHVDRCWLNPENRACKTCRHHQPAEAGYCGARPGCQCQDIEEECLVGVDLSEGVQTGCPKWEGASWL